MVIVARILLATVLGFGVSTVASAQAPAWAEPRPAGEALNDPTPIRYGTPAFSFVVPPSWVRLRGNDEMRVRLHFVAHLREVLDAPPDVPPNSFESLLSFAAFWIPEVDGYLMATLLDLSAPPQQIFDILHIHGRGKNDWGNSLYLTVDEVLRNERHALRGEQALTVDVHMSGGMTVAAKYFRVPSAFFRAGGLTVMLPRERWPEFEPLADDLRRSVRIGSSPEPIDAPQPIFASGDVESWDSVVVPQPQRAERPAIGRGRPLTDEERSVAMDASDVMVRMLVLALAYAVVFFLTLRLIYIAIVTAGQWFVPSLDLKAYREAADKDPWTLGLLKSERMIMVCATLSMGIAGVLLALFLRF